jgi:hypothetical protein
MNDDHTNNLVSGPIFDDLAPSSLTVRAPDSHIVRAPESYVVQTTCPDPDAHLAEIRKLSEKLDEAVSGIRDISLALERIVRLMRNI